MDELAAEVVSETGPDGLESDLVEIRRAVDMLEAEFLRRLTEVERRQTYRRHGVLSATSFLTDRCQLAGSTAREKVRVARALDGMPLAAGEFASGGLSYSQVRILAQAYDTHPDLYRQHEAVLVEGVIPLSVADTRRLVDHWRLAALPDEAVARMEAMVAQRRLFVSKTFEGMVRLDGWFDPVEGETIMTALAAVTAHRDRGAARASRSTTAPQRRADGLAEICRQWLANGRPALGGERPHVDVLVDLETLERRASQLCQVSRAGVIDRESARMLACDAGVARIVTIGRSEPLDVGRRTRTIPSAIRRALAVRDGGCRYPGCDRPTHWCEAHHIRHWADGGETRLDNLVLLCRRHHGMVHRRPHEISVVAGGVAVRAGPAR